MNKDQHYLKMIEHLIKNKDRYNIIELNQSTFEIIEYFTQNYELELELNHKNILSKKTLEYLKNTVR